jgi:negative regulator of flagellin synthesis FlgM
MKIPEIGGQGRPERPNAPEKRSGDRRPAASSEVRADRVEVSETAKQMSSLAAAAGRLPEVRQERVEALRRAIEDGSYQVDPRALARSILELEDGLFR